MKKVCVLASIALLGFSAPSFGQVVHKTTHAVKHGATKAWQGTKKGADKTWHATKKGAAKAKARVTSKPSEEWIGPQGQTIYIDGDRYYWVNGNGKRIYVSQSALRARNKS